MTTDTMDGVADERDASAVDRLDQEFKTQRENEHAALMAADQAKTDAARLAAQAKADVERSAARAVLVKRAGVAALLLGAGIAVACFGASFLLTRPERIVYRDVPGPERVVTRDVPGPERVVTRDVPGPERVVTKDVIKEVVKEVPGPTIYVTKKEKEFIDQPAYQSAKQKGQIIKSKDGVGVFFDNDTSFFPVNEDEADDTDTLVGDYGYCNVAPDAPAGQTYYYCYAIHNDVVIKIPHIKKKAATAEPAPKSIFDPPPVDPATAVPGSSVREEAFVNSTAYKAAPYKGILVANKGDFVVFNTGKYFYLYSGADFDETPYHGDYAYCSYASYSCTALHNGVAVEIVGGKGRS